MNTYFVIDESNANIGIIGLLDNNTLAYLVEYPNRYFCTSKEMEDWFILRMPSFNNLTLEEKNEMLLDTNGKCGTDNITLISATLPTTILYPYNEHVEAYLPLSYKHSYIWYGRDIRLGTIPSCLSVDEKVNVRLKRINPFSGIQVMLYV